MHTGTVCKEYIYVLQPWLQYRIHNYEKNCCMIPLGMYDSHINAKQIQIVNDITLLLAIYWRGCGVPSSRTQMLTLQKVSIDEINTCFVE